MQAGVGAVRTAERKVTRAGARRNPHKQNISCRKGGNTIFEPNSCSGVASVVQELRCSCGGRGGSKGDNLSPDLRAPCQRTGDGYHSSAGGNGAASVGRAASKQHICPDTKDVWVLHISLPFFCVGLFLWGQGVHMKQIPKRLQRHPNDQTELPESPPATSKNLIPTTLEGTGPRHSTPVAFGVGLGIITQFLPPLPPGHTLQLLTSPFCHPSLTEHANSSALLRADLGLHLDMQNPSRRGDNDLSKLPSGQRWIPSLRAGAVPTLPHPLWEPRCSQLSALHHHRLLTATPISLLHRKMMKAAAPALSACGHLVLLFRKRFILH